MAVPYGVVVADFARAQFHSLGRSALYRGQQAEIVRAMRQVGQLLAHAPRTAGNPMYGLRAAKLQVYNHTQASLYVESGVHESEPPVVTRFVASFRGQVE